MTNTKRQRHVDKPLPSPFHFKAYGLAITSDLAIPEFLPARDDQRCDLKIRLYDEQPPPEHLRGIPWSFDVSREQALLYFSGVAIFRLQGGCEIHVYPVVDADYRLIELYLSGTVISVLLYQRRSLVFHASCVAVAEQGAVLFAGESGAGKSSLAAAHYCRGHVLLSDDASALSEKHGVVTVVPAFPQMKVSREMVHLFDFDEKKLLPVHPSEQKMFYPCRKPYPTDPVPVRAICILAQGTKNRVTPLDARQSMIEAVRHTVPSRLLHSTGDPLHFSQCAAVAAKIPSFLLERTLDSTELPVLVDLVEQQIRDIEAR